MAKKVGMSDSDFRCTEGSIVDRDDMILLAQHSFQFSKDQGGCRFLQKKIDESDPLVNSAIFRAAIENFRTIMMDPFGNYLAQKITEASQDDEFELIIESIREDPVALAVHPHGTRSI